MLGDERAQVLGFAAPIMEVAAVLAQLLFRKAKVGLKARADKMLKVEVALPLSPLDRLCIQHAVEDRRHVRRLDSPRARLGGNGRERLRPADLAGRGLCRRL